jgi:hypothetical protein
MKTWRSLADNTFKYGFDYNLDDIIYQAPPSIALEAKPGCKSCGPQINTLGVCATITASGFKVVWRVEDVEGDALVSPSSLPPDLTRLDDRAMQLEITTIVPSIVSG